MLPRNDRCHSAVVAAALYRLSAPSAAGREDTPLWQLRLHTGRRFGVDDGSGVVTGMLWLCESPVGQSAYRDYHGFPLNDVQRQELSQQAEQHVFQEQAKGALHIGNTVRLQGRLNNWHGSLEVIASSVQLETDPNAEALHWCQVMFLWQQCGRVWVQSPDKSACVEAAAPSPTQLHDFAWQVIEEDLADRSGRFRMCDFMQEERLRRRVREEGEGGVGAAEVDKKLRRALFRLRDSGRMFQPCPTADTFSIKVAKELVAPAVLHCLRQQHQAHGSSSGGGLTLTHLHSRLASVDPRAKHASTALLQEAVDLLVQGGIIYEADTDYYHLVC